VAFSSFAEFFNMGGYALYVWSAFVISFLSLFGLVISTRLHGKRLREELKRLQARQRRISAAHSMERHL
jgi:heme exporter protein D